MHDNYEIVPKNLAKQSVCQCMYKCLQQQQFVTLITWIVETAPKRKTYRISVEKNVTVLVDIFMEFNTLTLNFKENFIILFYREFITRMPD